MVRSSTPNNNDKPEENDSPTAAPPGTASQEMTQEDPASQTGSEADTTHPINWQEQIEMARGLARIVEQENLSELEVESNGIRITLKAPIDPSLLPPMFPSGGQMPVYLSPPVASGEAEYTSDVPVQLTTEAAPDANLVPIVSPMVGVFYRASSPDSPPLVEVGDVVEIGQEIGIIEAMKVFNEINSEVEGTVVEIRAQNAELVETGGIIMMIRPS